MFVFLHVLAHPVFSRLCLRATVCVPPGWIYNTEHKESAVPQMQTQLSFFFFQNSLRRQMAVGLKG